MSKISSAEEQSVKQENRNLLMSGSFIVLNKAMIHTIGINETLLLSDLLSKEEYFEKNNKLEDGWFFNTQNNIYEDTSLSPYQQRKALDNLTKTYGIIEMERKGLPAKLYFRINHNKLKTLITSSLETKELEVKKLKNYNKNKENNNKDVNFSKEKLRFEEEPNGSPQSRMQRETKLKRRRESPTNPTDNDTPPIDQLNPTDQINSSPTKNNPTSSNPIKTNHVESYPHEDVKSIFRYWCDKSPPLIKHGPTSKTAAEALEAINWAINNGASEHDIRRAIDNYAYLLSTNTRVQTAAAAGRVGWKVGLNEFFTYSDFTVQLAKKKHIKLPVESWFLECLNDREELMAKYGSLVEDKVPTYTEKIRKIWKKIMRKEVIGPDEENAFRKAAAMLDEFREKKGLAGDRTYSLSRGDDMVTLLFEAIERDVRGNWARVTPGWLCSKRTFENRLPAYLIDLGYDYYGSFGEL